MTAALRNLDLERDGAVRLERAALAILPELEAAVSEYPPDIAGIRLFGNRALSDLISAESAIGKVITQNVGSPMRPVRAIMFDKTPANNWALGWHQDRTIAVAGKHHLDGFGPWSIKAGIHHVEPPFEYLERLHTVRIHLDDVDAGNAPLLIAMGSHQLGRIAEKELDAVVGRCEIAACHANAGDIWLYATPILHASASSSSPARRRVLQVDYADFELPSPLEWRGL